MTAIQELNNADCFSKAKISVKQNVLHVELPLSSGVKSSTKANELYASSGGFKPIVTDNGKQLKMSILVMGG
jgi:hypothetical protein